MKVLIYNLNGRGGMLHYSSQFSNAMSASHDVRVVVPSYADVSLYDEHIELWKIRTNPTLASFFLDSINVFAHANLISKIWKFRPEVVQIMDNHPWYFFYPLFGKCIGAKVYVIQHDPFPHTGEKQGLFHRVAIWVNAFLRKIADKLIVHGEKMRAKVIEMYKIPSEKVISIYHGSFGVFGQGGSSGKQAENTFLFFGRIVEYKGLDIFLQAIEMLEKDGVTYHAIIAGDGDISTYQDALRRIDKKHITLENRFIEDSEIASFFTRSNFVVLPYKDATASGVIPLAYSFSLPAIATDVGVLPDYVENERTGILITPNDPLALKAAMIELLKNPEKSKLLGKNAFQFQKEELSWESIVKKIYPETL